MKPKEIYFKKKNKHDKPFLIKTLEVKITNKFFCPKK